MDKFLSFLEPIMTLWVAILVLFLALGIFLPIWELSSGVNFLRKIIPSNLDDSSTYDD